VNCAAQDFDYVDVPEQLERIYEKYCPELYPEKKYLVVEITEQDMAQATDKFYEQLQRLKKKGFRLWLDDFGSGYSSLNVFSRFDVDLIKFDMDLLRKLDDRNGVNRKIMKAMTEIARDTLQRVQLYIGDPGNDAL
ncbi:MAG: EAL domain-containing protein, partial [Kiritimatiellae bacterium]|nr:EAL domain-containing protein [Kiritimatiellia bacterium]